MAEYRRPRSLETVAELCDAAVRLVSQAGWADRDVTRVALAMGEAVANAVEHGAGDTVTVALDLGALDPGGDEFTACIADDGPGPDARRVGEAHLPRDPLATSGRGLFILREIADDIRIDAAGTLCLTLRPRS